MSKKKLFFGIILIALIGLAVAYNYYQKIYGKNVLKNGFVYVKSTDTFNDLQNRIKPFVNDVDDFSWVASRKSFTKPKSGRYKVSERMSNNDLINLLRSGKQTPLTVSFNNQDSLEKLAGRIAQQIEPDSLSLLESFIDSSFLSKTGFNKNSVLGLFIPNSYEFYWDTSADGFRDRMLKEYKSFWNNNRLQKAKELKMTPKEVITLASIVQKETAKPEERPIVAGLYLNRLRKGILLQADPTVIYSIRQEKGQDYVVKRVLNKDLQLQSPYNTYVHQGLPPSLIAMPDISSIEAVLNHQKHNYYYMCASIDRLGYHEFASTLREHNNNAAKYQSWLNKQGIHR